MIALKKEIDRLKTHGYMF